MNTSDPLFWIMIIIAIMFVVMAIAVVVMAMAVLRVAGTVKELQRKVEPLLENVTKISAQGQQLAVQGQEIAAQGKEIAEQFGLMSTNLSNATKYFSDSAGLIKEEVRELKQLVGYSADTARDKVALVNRTIDDTHRQVVTTTQFINQRVVEPARELAAVLAGVRAGLEVLFAPAPRQIDSTYGDEEMFIG